MNRRKFIASTAALGAAAALSPFVLRNFDRRGVRGRITAAARPRAGEGRRRLRLCSPAARRRSLRGASDGRLTR